MDVVEVVDILSKAGGYGVAGLMFWMYQQEKKERLRYRDLHEEVLTSLANLPGTLEELKNEVAKRNQKSASPRIN